MTIRRTIALAGLVLGLAPLLHGCSGPESGAPPGPEAAKAQSDAKAAGEAKAGGAEFAADKVPAVADQEKLAKATLLDWNEGVQKKDFTKFHGTISKAWADQMTPADLAKAFKPITDQNEKGTNIAPAVKKMKINLTPPAAIDDNGLLVIQGFYPTKPSRTTFKLKYIAEDGAWKSAGLNVKMN